MVHFAKILTREEVLETAQSLKREENKYAMLKLAIFRLSCCVGLRCKEIQLIDLDDMKCDPSKPYINIRKEVTKGEKGKRKIRTIPLWWDTATYDDLFRWREFRLSQTGGENGPFICAQRKPFVGMRMRRSAIANHWNSALEMAMGPARARQVSIHYGRHTFGSLCHEAGLSLANIRDAMGHSSLAITSIYLHATDDGITNVFGGG